MFTRKKLLQIQVNYSPLKSFHCGVLVHASLEPASCPWLQLGHVFMLQPYWQEQTSRASISSWFNALWNQGPVGNSTLATGSQEASHPTKWHKNVGPRRQPAAEWEGPSSGTRKFLSFHRAVVWSLAVTLAVPSDPIPPWRVVNKNKLWLWGVANLSGQLLFMFSLSLPCLLVQ